MRVIAILAVAAVSAGAVAAGAVPPGDELALVKLTRAEDAYALIGRDIAVVEAQPEFALVRVDAEGRAALAGFEARALPPTAAPVYLAWPRPGENLPALEGVTVLAQEGDVYVVSGDPAAVERLPENGAEIKLVQKEPLATPRRLPAGEPLTYSKSVAAAVARVRPDNYFYHIQDLAAIPTRYSHAGGIDTAAAYLRDGFEECGYEVRTRPYDYDPGSYDYLQNCVFRDGGRLGWIFSTWGYVWRTDDYGATWDITKSTGRLNWGTFTSDDVGFAVGGKGFLARTDDGGVSWRNLGLSDAGDSLAVVTFADASLGLAAGGGGALYRTVDGGSRWTKITTPTTKQIWGLYARDRDRWWAVGAAGLVMRSDDGGLNWNSVSVPATNNWTMRAIAFADDTHAAIVGYEGTILYSEDGGANWRRVSGDYPAWPFFTNVVFADTTRGYACGSEAKVYRTDDAGANWTLMPTGLDPYDTMFGLGPLSRDEIWSSGGPSALVHSLDGGRTWTPVALHAEPPFVWNNVEAVKPGATHPGQIYILCAHFDAISDDPWNRAPGAEDNASGTAALLEAARVLADCRFDATLKFVAFSGEEQGLLGSAAYAAAEAAAGADIRGVFNMDMTAYLDEPAYDVEVRYNSFSRDLLARYREAARLYVPGYVIHAVTSGQGGSDHESFWAHGYPALHSIEYGGKQFYPYYHKTTDLPRYLTPAFGADVTRVNLAAAASLAGMREGPALDSGGVIAYPNPVRPSRGHDRVRFANLRAGGTFALYNLAGERVWETAVGEDGAVEWPLVNAAGAAAATGVYLFVVTDEGGSRTRGKIAVIR